jgi:hypothetical protein
VTDAPVPDGQPLRRLRSPFRHADGTNQVIGRFA